MGDKIELLDVTEKDPENAFEDRKRYSSFKPESKVDFNAPRCRLCLTPAFSGARLLVPCRCELESLMYVHYECLYRSTKDLQSNLCPFCTMEYDVRDLYGPYSTRARKIKIHDSVMYLLSLFLSTLVVILVGALASTVVKLMIFGYYRSWSFIFLNKTIDVYPGPMDLLFGSAFVVASYLVVALCVFFRRIGCGNTQDDRYLPGLFKYSILSWMMPCILCKKTKEDVDQKNVPLMNEIKRSKFGGSKKAVVLTKQDLLKYSKEFLAANPDDK